MAIRIWSFLAILELGVIRTRAIRFTAYVIFGSISKGE